VILDGQRVIPQRALAEGYSFKYDTIEPALRQILSA
jgi:NAD dependent epimerase/dehydratase family enzyme